MVTETRDRTRNKCAWLIICDNMTVNYNFVYAWTRQAQKQNIRVQNIIIFTPSSYGAKS